MRPVTVRIPGEYGTYVSVDESVRAMGHHVAARS